MNRAARRAQEKAQRKRGSQPGVNHSSISAEHLRALEMAGSMLSAGRADQCKLICEHLLQQSRQPEILNMLGLAQHALGEKDNTENTFRALLGLYPQFASGFYNYALILRQQRRFKEALQCYLKTVELEPDHADACYSIGTLLITDAQKSAEAIPYLQRALLLAPEQDNYWLSYWEAMKLMPAASADVNIIPHLIKRLSCPSQIASILTNIAIAFIILDSRLKELSLQALTQTLLLTLLEHQAVANYPLEQILTAARRHLLLSDIATVEQDRWLPFLQALSYQCFRNEYVYFISEEEHARLNALKHIVENGDPESLRWEILLYSCYAPLYRLSNATALAKFKDRSLIPIFRTQIDEPLEELRIRESIPVLDEIANEVSQQVQAQYESNPYPRWEQLETPSATSAAQELRRILPLVPPSVFTGLPEKPQILIAGCGTGRQALQAASRFKDSSVLAVDLSRASLAYAIRKLQAMNYDNINFLQADILSLTRLGRDFDIIECTGVLHHMQDPVAGWRILTQLLRPSGFMKIALYSETARQSVVQARNHISREKYQPTPDGIRQCRKDIAENISIQNMQTLMHMQDFYSLSECRDLMFHVQEHRFTLPQIAEILEALQLELLGFEHFTPQTKELYRKEFPGDILQNSLQDWHVYEQNHPHTFAGMYQFWVRQRKQA